MDTVEDDVIVTRYRAFRGSVEDAARSLGLPPLVVYRYLTSLGIDALAPERSPTTPAPGRP
jgi:hypothetical protein